MKAVVIIGAGVQGLAAARTFAALGYQVRVFEQLDDVGGTWHRKKSYPGLASHGPMKNILYPDFPAPAGFDQDKPFVRQDYVDYLKAYVRHFGLGDFISFNSKVTQIRYDRNGLDKPITVKVQDVATDAIDEQQCDFVIYTTFTTVGVVPRFRGDETFDGRIVHSSDLSDEILDDCLRNGKRIIVVGGNKSAADIVTTIEGRSYGNYLWVFRQNTWGVNYRSIAAGTRGVRIAFYLYYKVFNSRRLGWMAGLVFLPLRLFGFYLSPFPESHPLRIGYNGAIWRREQIDVLRRSRYHRGEIVGIAGRQVQLSSRGQPDDRGTIHETADLIVCATSFVQSKDAEIVIAKDGEEHLLEQAREQFLFRNMIHPAAPRIVFWNGAISPGRITLSAYLLALWFHSYFHALADERFSVESMRQEIDRDRSALRSSGLTDFNVWKSFQKAQGLLIEKNSQATLQDLGLLNAKLRMILLSASPVELRDIYLAKLDELKSLPMP